MNIKGLMILKHNNTIANAAKYIAHATSNIKNIVSKPPSQSVISDIIPKSDTEHFLLLFIFAIAMLLIRIIPVYSLVFTNWPGEYGNYVNFAADDAIYHMRLVHNTLQHYPLRIFFDPFSYFPFGMAVVFGPLFTLIAATTALIIGLGHPTPELVNHVSAYIPPVMGALCLIPLYFIVRKLFDKSAAIISAFILAFLPGEFLHRSTLGFMDHHVAEVLFSTTTCAFLIYALASFRTTCKNNHTILIYGLLCGITFGSYLLVWQGAILFGGIFFAFFTTQLLIDHFNNNDAKYLLSLASLVYLPPIVMILPYTLAAPLNMYPSYNIPILVVIFLTFVICYLLHIALRRNKLTKDLILAFTAVSILIIFALNKCLFLSNVFKGYYSLTSTYAAKTISEGHPTIIGYDGKFTARLFWNFYLWTMPLAIIGLCSLVYRTYKQRHPAEFFLLIWSLTIIALACREMRFNYYLAINIAILAGYSVYFLFNLAGYLKAQKIYFSMLFFSIAALIAHPMFSLLKNNNLSSGSHITHEWYNTLIWLKNHTPDPQGRIINKNLDYASGYYPVPTHYDYPESAYGIMTWWDEGHQITYIAHRIPNANPHVQGVIGIDGKTDSAFFFTPNANTHLPGITENGVKTGSAFFFTSTNEEEAVKNLNTVGSRYVIVNKDMATTKFPAIAIWSGDTNNWSNTKNIKITLPEYPGKTLNLQAPIDSQKFLQSMVSRLFYDDANGLQHFRLIYESEGDYYVQLKLFQFASRKPVSIKLNTLEFHSKGYTEELNTAENRNQIREVNKNNNLFTYYARPPVKCVKIFEKVKGAVVNGKVSTNIANDTPVKLTLKLKTKYNRVFTYEQTTKVNNGKYSFVVPYPTTDMYGDGYSYDIKPIDKYRIQINNKVTEISVPEDAVMLGEDINVH